MADLSEKNYSALFQEKKKRFSDEFNHIELIDFFKSPYLGYRYRAEFSLIKKNGYTSLAMTKDGQKKEITSFPIANLKIQNLMESLIRFINTNSIISDKLFQVEFQSSRTDDSLITLIYHKNLGSDWEQQALEFASSENVSVVGRSKKQKIKIGKDYVKETYSYLNNTYPLFLFEQCFSQTNPYICDEMLNWVSENVEPSLEDVLELHCGLGTFTILLSRLFRKVLATENSRPSIKGLKQNLELNNSNNVYFARLSGQETLAALNQERSFNRLSAIDLNEFEFSSVFLDPPREGLDDKTLLNVKNFNQIIYISCGFETFKRDMNYLEKTHEVKKLAMFDQFPYTDHIESGAILVKKAPD